MNAVRNAICIVLALALGASAARAQADAPRQSAGAHHPQYLERTGKRKPPGNALDQRKGLTPLLEHHDKEIKEHTLKSICKDAPGCEGGHLRK